MVTVTYFTSKMCIHTRSTTINLQYLVFSDTQLFHEEGAGWANLVTMAIMVDWVSAGVDTSTRAVTGRRACPTRYRRVHDLGTTVTGELIIA